MKVDFDYKKATTELDELLNKLKDPDTTLDEAIDIHAKAKTLIGKIESYLEEVNTVVAEQVKTT